jgi:hypothetical protein
VKRAEAEFVAAVLRTLDANEVVRTVAMQNADGPLCRWEQHRQSDYVNAWGVVTCGTCHPDPRRGQERDR